jgi:hypothetical protein
VTFSDQADGPAEVVAAEFRGSTWCYTLRLPSGATVQSTRSHLRHVAVGTRVRPALVPGHRPVVLPHGVDAPATPAPLSAPERERVGR